MLRPHPGQYNSYFQKYIDLVPQGDFIYMFRKNTIDVIHFFEEIPADKHNFAYAPGKWTIKQVFIHLCDEERYYAYKAFCYSRRSDVNLEIPMSEAYTKDFNASNRTLQDIREEYSAVRDATTTLFRTMTPEMLDFKDFPGKEVYTARSLGWFAVGHNRHHAEFVRKNYLG